MCYGLLYTTRRDGFVTKYDLSQVKSVHRLCSNLMGWSDADTPIIRDTHNFCRILGRGCTGMLWCHSLCQVRNYRHFEVTCRLSVWGRTTNRKGQKSEVLDIYDDVSDLKLTNENGQLIPTFSETSSLIYKSARQQIYEHCNLHCHLLMYRKYHTRKIKAEPRTHAFAPLQHSDIPAEM